VDAKLGGLAHGRDNNFNLIRILAAFAVLVSHSYALTSGSADAEPLRTTLGVTPGGIAVDVFFVTSGFLLAASIEKRPFADFALARGLRIYPALLVVTFATVFLLGPILTTDTLVQYFSGRETYKFLLSCSTLVFGVTYKLPGVFAQNPWPDAVNGSLWTMPQEIRCYLLLSAVWLVVRGSKLFPLAIAGVLCTTGVLTALTQGKFAPLAFMFFLGVGLYLIRDSVRLSHALAAGCLALLVTAAFLSPPLFRAVLAIAIPYLVLYAAYVPAGFVRLYNRLGDYSYGVYIFAYPIQQIVVSRMHGISPATLVVLATPITLLLAVLSWHLIEKRALALKDRVPVRRGYLGRGREPV
jgi:peptidoglycan/LPS O-acetylase OafA/YrhL